MRCVSVLRSTIGAEVELDGALAGDRRADHAGRVVEEEGDGLGRHELRRHDEVALVLAVFVVDHHHDLAATHGGYGVFNFGERHDPILPAPHDRDPIRPPTF